MIDALNNLILLSILAFFGWMAYRTHQSRSYANRVVWGTATVLCLFFLLYGPQKTTRKIYYRGDTSMEEMSFEVESEVLEVESRGWGLVIARDGREQLIPEDDVMVEEARQPLAAIFLFGGVIFSITAAIVLTRGFPSRAERWGVRVRSSYRSRRDKTLRQLADRVEQAKKEQ